MTININKLEKKLQIKVKNKNLLVEALTHKSIDQNFNNERLEFLGDRVIGLILSKKLLDLYPNKSEGDLDKRFAKLVNRKTCASIALLHGIENFINTIDQNHTTRINEKILSDTCEAIIGAIYVDKGFNYVKNFVLRLWDREIKKSDITVVDPKTKLQEYSLKHFKNLPIYRFLSSKGPKHNLTFKICVSIKGSKKFVGVGNSKQKAEQNAAENLLKNIDIN